MKLNRCIILSILALAIGAVFMAAFGVLGPEYLLLSPAVPVLGAALTQDRDTPGRDGQALSLGVAAAKKIYAGALVAVDANGYATPGAVSTTIRGVGRAEEYVDNSAGANGAVSVSVKKGVFRFGNSSSGDLIAAADIGNDCYIVDDQTVAKTNGTGTRSVAGRIFDVDSSGVWVKFI